MLENDEVVTPDGGGQDSDKELAAAIKRRDAAVKRAQAAEAKAAELEAQLAEHAGKSGSIDKVVQHKDSIIKSLTAERDDALSKLDGYHRETRKGALVDAIVAQTNAPRVRVRALLREIEASDPEFEVPESLDKHFIKSTVDTLKALDADTFTSTDTGKARPRSTPAPGAFTRSLDADEQPGGDFAAELALRFKGAAKTPY